MLRILKSVWKAVKRLTGLLLPMFSKARKPGAASNPAVRWGLHIALVVFVLIFLSVLHRILGLQSILPNAPLFLKQLWLPLIFLLLYTLGWLVWWFYHLLNAAPEASPFPDIDRAWGEAMQALSDKSLDLTEAPLFLLLGRPDEGEEVLFEGISLVVPQSPSRADAPLHVYATSEAIYLSCGGASLLGEQSRILAGEVVLRNDRPTGPDTSDEDDDKTRTPGESVEADKAVECTRKLRGIEDRIRAEGRELSRTEKLEVRRLKRVLSQIAQPQVLHNRPEEVARLRERLDYLGRLVARQRRPFCGLNGIMLLIPMAATDNDLEAHETGTCCLEDLATIREATQVQCPIFATVCDLDQLAGYDAFIKSFPNPQRGRVGRSFPLVPDLRLEQIPGMLESGIRWLCLNSLPALAIPQWKLETPGVTDLEDVVKDNSELFSFLSEIRERQPRISKLLTRSVVGELFGGCYVAGTGRSSDRDRAFLRAVFGKLTGEQDHVSWTPEAIAEEEAYHRVIRLSYRTLAVVLVSGIAILAFTILN